MRKTMSYMKFTFQFDQGAYKGQMTPVKIQIPPILMKREK